MKVGASALHQVSWWLLWVGGINWGLVGLFDFDLVFWLLGAWPMVARVVYVLVGLAALVLLFTPKKK